MNVLLVAVVLGLGAGQAQPGQPGKGGKMGGGMDGKWQIVYAEEGGRRNNSWENRLATISKGTLSYEAEGGKKRSLQLKRGPGQTVEATPSDDGGKGAMKGVYILGQDYLCLSLSKGGKLKAGPEPVPVNPGAAPGAPQVGGGTGTGSSGDFILILRRVRGSARGTPLPPPKPPQ
jgi:hypothetical protein